MQYIQTLIKFLYIIGILLHIPLWCTDREKIQTTIISAVAAGATYALFNALYNEYNKWSTKDERERAYTLDKDKYDLQLCIAEQNAQEIKQNEIKVKAFETQVHIDRYKTMQYQWNILYNSKDPLLQDMCKQTAPALIQAYTSLSSEYKNESEENLFNIQKDTEDEDTQ
jgi:hypothetical protein